MKKRIACCPRLCYAALFGLLLVVCAPLSVTAHPLGNFSVNRYSRIEIAPERVRIVYILDMAEIPTFQELRALPTDITTDAPARDRYATAQAERIRGQVRLTVDGTALPLTIEGTELTFPPGQGDLQTLRLRVRYTAPLRSHTGEYTADYRDDNTPERLGWREVVVRTAPGVALVDSSAPTQDASDELRDYPQDLLQSPLNRTTARLRFAPGTGGVAVAAPAVRGGGRSDDAFAALIAAETSSLPVLLLALCAAAAFGAAHALTPGHGKTLVGAYLVGSRGTPVHALALGLTVTLTHTASVFALGLITLFASRFILPEQVFPILGAASGACVGVLGGTLFWHRLRTARARWRTPAGRGPRRESIGDADYAHAHEHDDGTVHSHGPFGTHSHALPTRETENGRVSWRGLLALGVSGGPASLPFCPDRHAQCDRTGAHGLRHRAHSRVQPRSGGGTDGHRLALRLRGAAHRPLRATGACCARVARPQCLWRSLPRRGDDGTRAAHGQCLTRRGITPPYALPLHRGRRRRGGRCGPSYPTRSPARILLQADGGRGRRPWRRVRESRRLRGRGRRPV